MSDITQVTAAHEIEQQAALWIDRKDRAAWSEADQAELEAWFAQSLTHSIAFWRLNAAWHRTERLAAIRPSPRSSLNLFETGRLKLVFLRTAAALAVGAIVASAGTYLLAPAQQSYATPVGGREILSLVDGSQIELNTSTVLRMSGNADERKVWLDKGEAYFQIKHDATHPFVVNVGGHRVTDLGTKFSIRTDTRGTEIALTEGRAQVDAVSGKGKSRMVVLSPGDVATATAEGISVTKKSERALEAELGWRNGVLIFNNTTLADAAAQFNRYSRRRLVVDPSVANRRIDGTFPSNNATAFAVITEHILHLRVRGSENEIIISR